METTKERETKSELLASDTVTIAGLHPEYFLWRDAGNYRVEIRMGKEKAEENLGEDLILAVDCYRAIRKGGVTPCTLSDVVEELVKKRENS